MSPSCFLICFQLCFLISLSLAAEEEGVTLTQSELRNKYGQDGTTFNDGKCCNRVCDGRKMTCYYEFCAQLYDTMSGLCNGCGNGTTKDCFNKGCVPGNGVGRSIMTINQQMPAPTIFGCKGDRIIVDVTNAMAGQELTLHWHGLHQKATPWMDGVPMVTQCPIYSGNTFRYSFVCDMAGTFYYHSHTGLQRSDGLVGELIIRDPDDPNANYYDYDLPEHSMLVSDWSNRMSEENAPGYRNQVLLPDSVLINGMGSYYDESQRKFTHAPMPVFYVQRGKRHRFRIDNASSQNCPFEIIFQHHNLTVIATDSYSIEPLEVGSIVCSAGERFDVVMDAINDPKINESLIVVRAIASCIAIKLQEFARVIYVDDLHNYTRKFEDHEPLKERRPAYESFDGPRITLNNALTDCKNSESLCIASLTQKQINEWYGESLRDVPAEVIPLTLGVSIGQDRPINYISAGDYAMVTTVNSIASQQSSVPGLTQDDSHVEYCNANKMPKDWDGKSVCHCPHLIEMELCKVYEFFVKGGGNTGGYISHPMHIHGHAAQVIDMGSMEQYESGRTAFANAKHKPPLKDTIVVQSGGFVRFRIKACNPGYWFAHCHFELHMHAGMSFTFKVGNRTDMVPPPPDFPKCGHYMPAVRDGYDD